MCVILIMCSEKIVMFHNFFFRDYNYTAFFKNWQDLENSAELVEGDFQTI